MSEENVVEEVEAVEPVSEQEETADPVAEEEQQEAPEKKFSQEDLDAAIGKRLAKEQRKFERELERKMEEALAKANPKPKVEDISLDDFDTYEEYADALAEAKAERLLAQKEEKRTRERLIDDYRSREEEARAKYDDFDQVAYNNSLRVTDIMAETIQASEIGPDIAYFLGGNPKEADRISRLSPLMQAKEIGKIEAKLSDAPSPTKKTTSAPSPISPVTAKSPAAPKYDTTDPRSIKSMSTSEWIAAERQRQIKEWEARR